VPAPDQAAHCWELNSFCVPARKLLNFVPLALSTFSYRSLVGAISLRPILEVFMIRILLTAFTLLVLCIPTHAQVAAFPTSFRTQNIPVAGATIHVRVGGKGPAVVLLHGFGNTSDMWATLAADLAKDYTVVVPDLRGMGLSSIPDSGYDKKTQAGDIREVLATLGVEHSVVVGHDIGTMVAVIQGRCNHQLAGEHARDRSHVMLNR
jgi:predicted alpha/beta-fold hydrolase